MQNVVGTWTPRVLSVLRIVAGMMFLEHGTSKLFAFPYTRPVDHLQLVSLIGLAALLEAIGGTLVVIGMFTRLVAFVLSGEMAVAYFMAHAPRGFYPISNGGELSALYAFVFLYLASAGGGKWSLDRLRAGSALVSRS